MLMGGGVLFAAGAAGAGRVLRAPKSAYAPWQEAGSGSDARLRALSYAILAPNPHNMQPWKIRLEGETSATLYVDTDRLLPHTDPFSRQIVIGLGCFLEVLRIAALNDGIKVKATLFPQGSDAKKLDQRPVACCEFLPADTAADPLFAQIVHRHTNRETYDITRPISKDTLGQILSTARHTAGFGAVSQDQIGPMRDLSAQAFRVEMETDATYKESVDVFRIGAREVDADPDGLPFTGPFFETLSATGLFTRETAMDRDGSSYETALEMVEKSLASSMGFIWQVTDTNTRADQIAAGCDWVRLHLKATELGVAMQPLSQALQEYPEMDKLYKSAHSRLAPDGGTVQMWGRVGYAPAISPSPRWPLEAKLID